MDILDGEAGLLEAQLERLHRPIGASQAMKEHHRVRRHGVVGAGRAASEQSQNKSEHA